MPRKQLILFAFLSAATFGLAAGGESTDSSNSPRFAVAGSLSAVIPDPMPIDDPFPILRIRANESDIPSILKSTDAGPLVQLKRSEFESRVRAAGRHLAEARTGPRITRTRFSATLVNGDLVGTAELDLANASSIPQFLMLDPLRLALSAATWDDGREAIIGVPQGSTSSAVWVDHPGQQKLKFGWSAAGTIEYGERRFELRVPPALSTELELELPAGQRPIVTNDVLLSGPFSAPNDKKLARWNFRFGGRQRQLDFTIRSTVYSGVAATANLAARYDITTDLLTGSFEYDLRPAKGTVGEWVFTVDPGLRVTDVAVNNRAGWSVDQPDAPGLQRQLRVTLNQPGIGGKVMISSVAPFPYPSRQAVSPLPAIRPVGAILDEETMEIHLSPELKLERWMPGDYRVADSQILPDQSQTLFLSGTLLQHGGDRVFRQPPTITTAPTEPEFDSREQIAWRFDGDRAIAQVQIALRVRRLPLFRLILHPPSDYSFVKATSSQDDLIASTSYSNGGVVVEFNRPLTAEQTADFTFEFRGPQVGPKQFIFPAFTPVGASERIGVLGIYPGPRWDIDVKPGVGIIQTSSLDLTAPRPPANILMAYRYRGINPDGFVTLSPMRTNSATDVPNRIEHKSDKSFGNNAVSPTSVVPDQSLSRFDKQLPDRTWQFANLYQVTSVRTRSEVEVAFGGTAVSSAANLLPIQLPPGAKIRSAYVGERLLERSVQQISPEGILTVPIHANGPIQFELWYNLPVEPGFSERIRSPEPGLPGECSAIPHWWIFGGNLLPCWPVQGWDRSKAADLPVLLGSSDSLGAGVLTSRTQVDEVRVISTKTANLISISISTSLFLLGWIGIRRRTRLYALLVLGSLFAIGTVNLLGPPWWQRTTVVPLAIGLPIMAGLVILRGHRAASGTIAAMVILCTLPLAVSTAQPTTPAVVVLLPPDPDGSEKVIAPKSTIDRLAATARSAPSGALIATADYEVTVEDNIARVIARFTAYALGDSNLTASLPLSDARLENVTIDGKPAYPNVQKPGLYSVGLSSGGRHEIEVHFTSPLSAAGTERELHFGVPECPMTRVTAHFPTTARQIQLPGRIGKQTLVEGNTRRLEISTGSVKAIQFRWRDGGAGTPSIKIREACIWDVSEKGAELTACYHIRADQGPITNLKFDLPSELEPVDVSLRPDPTGGMGLRDWSLLPEQGGFRQLRLDLQGPTTGRMLVTLSCRLRKAVSLQPLLRFPKPLIQGGVMEADVAYGLRIKESTAKVSIEDLRRIGTIDYDPGVLIRDKEWLQVPALRLDANSTIRVFRPTQDPGVSPELRPTLRPIVEPPTVNLDTTWQVEPLRADANGTIHWSRKEPVVLVEFAMPGVLLLEVRGKDVGRWNQNAGRIYVWMRKPINEGELEWTGTTPVSVGQQPGNPFAFEAAVPRVMDARLGTDIVRIRPVESWKVHAEKDRGWTQMPQKDDAIAFQTATQGAAPIRVLFTPATPPKQNGTPAQIAPLPQSRRVREPSQIPEIRAVNAEPQPTADKTEATEPISTWTILLSNSIAWCIAFAILTLLLVRYPQSTWPEQVGLVVGLFGVAVLGYWSLGIGGWVVARCTWLGQTLRRSSIQQAGI